MSRILIKLCGLRTPEDAGLAAALGADYAGAVFYPPSPRNVSIEQAAAMKKKLTGTATKLIAVTVDPDDTLLATLVAEFPPHGIQLHGSETPARVSEIRARYPQIMLIKAIGVRSAADIASAQGYTAADMLLFDAKHTNLPGGTGQSFDWSLLSNVNIHKPWFLSGGLNEANVADAIRMTGAQAVDVSSGIESAPGVKDHAKMRAFVEAVRSA